MLLPTPQQYYTKPYDNFLKLFTPVLNIFYCILLKWLHIKLLLAGKWRIQHLYPIVSYVLRFLLITTSLHSCKILYHLNNTLSCNILGLVLYSHSHLLHCDTYSLKLCMPLPLFHRITFYMIL